MLNTCESRQRELVLNRPAVEQIRAGYVYRNGDEHFLTDKGRDALAQPGVQPGG